MNAKSEGIDIDELVKVSKPEPVKVKAKRIKLPKLRPEKIPTLPILLVVVLCFGGLSVFNFFNKNNQVEFENATQEASEMFNNFISSDAFESLKVSFTKLETSLASLPTKMGIVTDNVDRLDRETKEVVSLLTDKIDLLQDQLNKVEDKFSRFTSKQVVKTRKLVKQNRDATFDLKIDGMGSWGKTSFLTIKHNGKYDMLEIGRIIKGWELIKLDKEGRIATFLHSSGKRVNINV